MLIKYIPNGVEGTANGFSDYNFFVLSMCHVLFFMLCIYLILISIILDYDDYNPDFIDEKTEAHRG